MEFCKEGARFYIFTRSELGDCATKIHDDLKQVFGEHCCSYDTVARWIRQFNDGRDNLKDKARSGRPPTSVNKGSLARAEAILKEDRSVTIGYLAVELGISVGSTHTLLHDKLGLRKRCSRWIPHQLTPDQKMQRVSICRDLLNQFEPKGPKRLSDVVTGDECWIPYFVTPHKQKNMVWMAEDDPRPTILKPGFRSRKRMFTIFFNTKGPVIIDIMPEGATITANYYTNTILTKLVREIDQQRPKTRGSRILLHQDNASAHKAKLTQDFLQEKGLHLLPHAPYSPDLAPCDFWLFPRVKALIAGKPFARIQDLAKAVHSALATIPQEEYRRAFQKWLERMQRCIDAGGEYFEGMK